MNNIKDIDWEAKAQMALDLLNGEQNPLATMIMIMKWSAQKGAESLEDTVRREVASVLGLIGFGNAILNRRWSCPRCFATTSIFKEECFVCEQDNIIVPRAEARSSNETINEFIMRQSKWLEKYPLKEM